MMALSTLGWGAEKIGRKLGCRRNTVREYLRSGSWKGMDVSGRSGGLAPHAKWLTERMIRHRGNADVVRQLRAEAPATVRFETAPGQQLQIDFGSMRVLIDDEEQRIHLWVATLGLSARLQGLEGAMRHFGGVPCIDAAVNAVGRSHREARHNRTLASKSWPRSIEA